jgi:choline kinase
MKHNYPNNDPVTTALLLAAGTGSRLYPVTQNAPKCLTTLNGVPILERLVSSLKLHGFKRLVIVTGYLESHIREFLADKTGDLQVEYIFSPLYKTTNNIYSLWMARKVINEPFLLLESDLVFDDSLLSDMLYPNRIALARMQPWMNGTYVTVDKDQKVKEFFTGNTPCLDETRYKTVNIYSLSLSSWHRTVEKLNMYIADEKVNGYYEVVFAELVADGSLTFEAVSFDTKPWYEIDTLEDLANAEKLFLSSSDSSMEAIPLANTDSVNHGTAKLSGKPRNF